MPPAPNYYSLSWPITREPISCIPVEKYTWRLGGWEHFIVLSSLGHLHFEGSPKAYYDSIRDSGIAATIARWWGRLTVLTLVSQHTEAAWGIKKMPSSFVNAWQPPSHAFLCVMFQVPADWLNVPRIFMTSKFSMSLFWTLKNQKMSFVWPCAHSHISPLELTHLATWTAWEHGHSPTLHICRV